MLHIAFVLSIVLGPEMTSAPYTSLVPPSAECSNSALVHLGATTFVATPAVVEGKPGISAFLINSQLTATRTAFFPSVEAAPVCIAAATNGSDVLVLWTSVDHLLRAMLLTPDLAVVQAPPIRIDMLSGSSIGVGWQSGAQTYLVAAGSLYIEMQPDLRGYRIFEIGTWSFVDATRRQAASYDAVATSATTSVLSARGFAPSETRGIPGQPRTATIPEAFSVAVSRPHTAPLAAIESRSVFGFGPTTVALVGDRALVAWIRLPTTFEPNYTLSALWLDGAFVFRHQQPYITNPKSASAGEHVLLVWEEGVGTTRIAGTVLGESTASAPFIIAESSTSPRKPSVISLGAGRFLVAYQLSETVNTSRLGGRMVYVDPPARRRAVH